MSASVLFDVICRATPSRLACTPYPPRRPTLCLSRLWESLFRKVRVKLSSQVSMSPPSSVNKKRFAARVCGLLPKFEVAVLAFEKKKSAAAHLDLDRRPRVHSVERLRLTHILHFNSSHSTGKKVGKEHWLVWRVIQLLRGQNFNQF